MNRFLRRGVLGAAAAGVAGFHFLLSAATTGYDFAVGIVSGIGYAVSVRPARKTYVDHDDRRLTGYTALGDGDPLRGFHPFRRPYGAEWG